MVAHHFHTNGYRSVQIRETPTKTPTVLISGTYGLMDLEKRSGLFVAPSQKGYGGFLGPCPYVEGPQKFL